METLAAVALLLAVSVLAMVGVAVLAWVRLRRGRRRMAARYARARLKARLQQPSPPNP